MRDAEYILNCSSRESCGELPWNEKEADFCIPYGARSSGCFWYDVIDDRCFSVTSDELLTPEEIIQFFSAVEEADRKEVTSFVENKCFKLAVRDSRAYNRIDGTWVRKWANRKERKVKSRCCARAREVT